MGTSVKRRLCEFYHSKVTPGELQGPERSKVWSFLSPLEKAPPTPHPPLLCPGEGVTDLRTSDSNTLIGEPFLG